MDFIVEKIADFKQHELESRIQRLPQRSGIYLDFDYLAINDLHEEGETYVAVYFEEKEAVVYPFVRRNLSYGRQEFADIMTPYEYGGEWSTNNDLALLRKFRSRFKEYCEAENILTEFQRIDPFGQIPLESSKNEEYIKVKENIVISLHATEEEIFGQYHKNNRRDIRLAIRNQIQIEKSAPSQSSINEFKELYYSTMDVKNTSQYYYFNEDYFNALAKFSSDKMDVYRAYTKENNLASAALVLKKNGVAHYHLSGTNRDYTKLCATNLMLHEAAMQLKKEGYNYFHLGGAASSQEGLYRFKKKFSNETRDYFVCKRVVNNKVYEQLNQQIIKDKELYNQTYDEGFFPLYRKLIELT